MKRFLIVIIVVALLVFIAEQLGIEVGELAKGFWGFLVNLFEPGKHP